MQKVYFLFSILIIALLTGCASQLNVQGEEKVERTATNFPQEFEAEKEIMSKIPPADCPVTTKSQPTFQAPEPFSINAPWEGLFWFGSEHLWTALHNDGVWAGLLYHPHGYTQKIMWWSDLYSLPDELQPELVVTAKRLDEEAPPLGFYGATNAMADDIGEAILTGVEFPTLGCWEVTGQYKKASLTFVVWITSEE